MAREGIKDSALIAALGDFLTDLSDLARKEIRLAKAEVTETVKSAAKSGVWMAVAGLLAFIAALLLIQALVFAIASFGIGLHWSALIVALLMAGAAAGAFFYGRSLAGSLAPRRSINQINRDISAFREQLT